MALGMTLVVFQFKLHLSVHSGRSSLSIIKFSSLSTSCVYDDIANLLTCCRPQRYVLFRLFSSSYSLHMFVKKLWPLFWSRNHGPVFSSEPELTKLVLAQFRDQIRRKQLSKAPIWQTMKDRQDVFNGFGAQESCDALCSAFLHPCTPTIFICTNDELWTRFYQMVIDQHCMRVERIRAKTPSPLPHVSSSRPFYFNRNGHRT
jgi:hypothetical protein